MQVGKVVIMQSFGMCIGSSTLSVVELSQKNDGTVFVANARTILHNGNPQRVFEETLRSLSITKHSKIAVTGRKFRNKVNLSSVSEPEALETALLYLHGSGCPPNAVVSAGGETFMVYVIDGNGRISSVQTGNKCASGTGEFFLQQIRRMGISLDDAVKCAEVEEPYMVSGRCSVFCKSDCTHATNKGVPTGRVAAGLCRMMAGKILELLRQIPKENIMLVGGCAQNSVMIEYLRRDITNLIVPKEAPYFEALGCALWALNHDTKPLKTGDEIFKKMARGFPVLPSLNDYKEMVEFKRVDYGAVRDGDSCIVGLDVGSTTTKAVVMRREDNAVVASVYLRTSGNPVGASRACYQALHEQLSRSGVQIRIEGLGVTGSGRQIAGLHAMTDGIINEIIAHAAGALYFDNEVDTIFEIGGQDAKYTYITNGVPSDYAMNEACSAGTGSFLEEAARETLGIAMEDIADIALRGSTPPNFNDQCAAFISSDIKSAFNEGVARENIVAGLVYSICMNYNNRVKGNRPVGHKVFMQGGVCYNRAVPLAMASLTGKHIIVPPDPGLIGALGVALEIKRRVALGLLDAQEFSLGVLKDRELEYGSPFICNGGKEKCDRKCEIARIKIEGKTYPFGGACNRWYNLRSHITLNAGQINYVDHYEKLIFHNRSTPFERDKGAGEIQKTIGINKSFMVNAYFPMYHHFFSKLGLTVVLADELTREGKDRKSAPFCYPAEIAHGYFLNLLDRDPDYLFLPQFKGDHVKKSQEQGVMCPLSQGEPFYLAAAFKDHAAFRKLKTNHAILGPTIDFSNGFEAAEDEFVNMARQLKFSKKQVRETYAAAVDAQRHVHATMSAAGSAMLERLERNPDEFAVVVFGRSYNAFVSEANMGIPNKFASRNVTVIPFNYLPIENEVGREHMYWSAGQHILKGAQFVKQHPQLFGCYITNFSCGPDSFLIGYFRREMGRKPSLTLELDSHVADAGLETRIEAFLDIIKRYRELAKAGGVRELPRRFVPATIEKNAGAPVFVDSRGVRYPLYDPKIHLIFPSMGRFISEAGSAVFRNAGVRSSTLPPADEIALKFGRGHTTCKECLPLQITVGSLLKYLAGRPSNDEKLIYFMPTASGPCRFGQYAEFMKDMIAMLELRDVALFSSSAENSYADIIEQDLTEKLWTAVVLSDIFEEIQSVVRANAYDTAAALKIFEDQWQCVIRALEGSYSYKDLLPVLESVVARLARIECTRSLQATPVVLLTGEIYVRHDGISRQYIVKDLAERGFATKVSTVAEWVYYTDWCVQHGVAVGNYTARDRLHLMVRRRFMRHYERTFRAILSASGLCRNEVENVRHIIHTTRHLIDPKLVGEAILTVGAAMSEVPEHYCGAIAIGPFGCMPNRLAEAILTREMNMAGKRAAGGVTGKIRKLREKVTEFPFLAIESDGNRFPPIIEARLEAFLLQAGRVYAEMQKL